MMVPDDFEEQRIEFENADDGLKWQWFTEVGASSDHHTDNIRGIVYSMARGFYVAKIDITLGQTDSNQQTIAAKEIESILFEDR